MTLTKSVKEVYEGVEGFMINEKFYQLSEEKRQQIINGALKIFGKYDYKKASTEEIAKAAGISKALIFHYFKNKKELYLFLYEYSVKTFISQMSELHNYEERDFFKILVDAQLCKIKVLQVHPDIVGFILKVYLEENDEVRPFIDKGFASIVKESSNRFMERADTSKFKEGIKPEMVLNLVLWMAEGFMRAQPPEKMNDLDSLNNEYLSYIELLRKQFYKEEEIK